MIDEARKNADVAAILDSGPYFTLGDVEVVGLRRYRENVVKNVNAIEVGEAYNRQKLLDYQKGCKIYLISRMSLWILIPIQTMRS